jgi:hypothetical protein
MRLHIAALAAFALPSFFVTLVGADCCAQAGGISGYCEDGTRATPCCGRGPSNRTYPKKSKLTSQRLLQPLLLQLRRWQVLPNSPIHHITSLQPSTGPLERKEELTSSQAAAKATTMAAAKQPRTSKPPASSQHGSSPVPLSPAKSPTEPPSYFATSSTPKKSATPNPSPPHSPSETPPKHAPWATSSSSQTWIRAATSPSTSILCLRTGPRREC